MIEVTDEMRREGGRAANKACLRQFGSYWNVEVAEDFAVAAYRAMRDLEPVPPELRNRQAPPPAKTGDPGMRPEDQARGFNPTEWGANPQVVYSPMQRCGVSQSEPHGTPREGAAGRMFNDPAMAEMDRRIDALTALVFELAARSQGYPPGDATLQRLIAELEPTP